MGPLIASHRRCEADRRRPVPRLAWATIVSLSICLAVPFVVGAEEALKGAESEKPRPSILLIVLDTVRADAVSAYGKVAGTTPNMDELAAKGIRYSRAFAPAPWTLPSHATLFTGRGIDEHRVSMPGVSKLPDEFETLAEQLGNAGYETAAFSENMIVSDNFDLLRGFDVRETTKLTEMNREDGFEAPKAFKAWLARRDSSRPFFVFVNVLDAHRPYTVRDVNPWVPEGIPKHLITGRPPRPERLICGGIPPKEQLEVLRGLYLGDVHDADRKLGEVVAAARRSLGDAPLITIATSDHGELLGEHDLLGHEFSVHPNLLNVPLVVHGADDLVPGTIETPVGLEDVMPTILEWAAAERPTDLKGRPLPRDLSDARSSTPRSFFAAYRDDFVAIPEELKGRVGLNDKDEMRQFCAKSNRVFGAMASLIRYPFKFVWYENYPASLYDLSWDLQEKSDQIKYRPDLVESFSAEMTERLTDAQITQDVNAGEPLSDEAIEALKQLGYIH